jgi:EAL domain-containing protein (putative c-di-GMP-specific phosphodiesterase class I)/FixJ family two-component response regulator
MDKSALKILVLDDEPFMLRLLAHMLAGLGYTSVTTCDSGSDALERMSAPAAQSPNLILMDLNMPQMDGIEFVRKLVEHGYRGSLLLISGEDEKVMQMAEKLVHAHHITVLGHLRKPASREALARVLCKWRPRSEATEPARKSYGVDELRHAIGHGQLVNYYQPKVLVASGGVDGVETLVRWRHPLDGLVFPDQFIGVAEEHGLIDELTRLVLAGALAQARRWRGQGLPLRIAVNVSMDNLSSVEFADFVAATAFSAGLAPQDLMLEVTEGRLMQDQRAPLETLTRLRMKRFRLSIDDFGTGHSSLAQLRDICFDELKIDRSFVHGALHDVNARAMYDASLGLGKQLGMEVVAEGVEDSDDWELVRLTGCELAQGYFIGRPMPAADLPDWIASWNERLSRGQLDVRRN